MSRFVVGDLSEASFLPGIEATRDQSKIVFKLAEKQCVLYFVWQYRLTQAKPPEPDPQQSCPATR